MSSKTNPNNNWDLAILTFVILILLFFWFYKFLFITDPTQLKNPISVSLFTSENSPL
jgi:hypothetical protein